MAQFGSRTNSVSQNLSAVQDPQGNLIVSPDNSFGASPLGIAARTQALYGIPNANFNLLPPDSTAEIATGNELPYWQIVNLGAITATMTFDETAQAWGVLIDPSSAGSGDSLSLTTRSYLLNDSNLSLRQKAFASITKVGTMATSQWNLVMNATYYDSAGSALSTYAIGTANSGTTWTSINGFTTSGTAAIDAAAQYLDLDLTLTTTTAVTGTAKVDLNSVLLQTSTGGGGGAQSFVITETFTTSGTFTVPTGVDYVTVLGISAGGGGQSGVVVGAAAGGAGDSNAHSAGGASGYWALRRDIYVGDVASVSVGIGAGGVGGTARTVSKGSGATTSPIGGTTIVSFPGAAGATTFGSYLSIPGPGTSGAGGTPTGVYGLESVADTNANGANHAIAAYVQAPFTTFVSTGNAGTNASGSGGAGTSTVGAGAPTGTAIAGNGGGGAGGRSGATPTVVAAGTAGNGGGGSGGGASLRTISAGSQTIVATGGAGGAGVANSGAGGGGGGDAAISVSSGTNTHWNSCTLTITSGKGGDGGSGLIVVSYIA